MSYINFFISKSSSIPVSERIAIKKQLFGMSDELTANKFAFGFFLDSGVLTDQRTIEKLSRYEFYAASLSCQKLVKELNAFSQTAEFKQLRPETQKQLKEVVDLLEKSQNLYFLVDDFRSSDPRKIFLALTGMGKDSIGDQGLQTEQLQEIVGEARRLVTSLSPGEKAVFPAGNIVHETLLSVEKVDDEHFELRYFNTADYAQTKRKFLVECSTLYGDAFWKDLYSAKFLKKETPLIKQFNEFDSIECTARDCFSRLRQKRNTCHLRSLLAFVKDMIVEKSPLSSEDAYLDNHTFKELFGQFLLKNGHLSNEDMDRLCQEKQKKRATRGETKLKSFQQCREQGKVEETLLAYVDLLKDLFPNRYFNTKSSGNLIYDLVQMEKQLIEAVEGGSILPDDFASHSGKVSNPWVKQTLTRAQDKLSHRQKEFHKYLKEELAEISTSYYIPCKTFKRSAYQKWNDAGHKLKELASQNDIHINPPFLVEYRKGVDGFPLGKKEVQDSIALFEKEPELLHFLDQKPCCRAILKQAVQRGMIKRVEGIYQHLPPQDQEEVLTICGDFALNSSAIPATVDFIVNHPHSQLVKSAFAKVCLELLDMGRWSEFLKVAKTIVASDPELFKGFEDLHIAWRPLQDIPQEEQVQVLTLLNSLYQTNKVNSCSGVVSWLSSCLGQSALKQEKTNLEMWAKQLDAPEWKNYCGCILLNCLYQQGDFEKIKKLAEKTSASRYPLNAQFNFSEETIHEGFELLKMSYPPAFLSMVFHDLLKFACQIRSMEILAQILKIYVNHPEFKNDDTLWPKFNFKDLVLLTQSMEELRGDQKKIYKIVSALIDKIDSNEKFDETNRIVNALCLKYPSIVDELDEKSFYNLSQYINPSLEGLLVQAVRKTECYRAVMNLISDGGDYRRGESFTDYRKHFKTFIKEWQLMTEKEDLSNLNRVYKKFIQPIFKMHIYSRNSEIVVLELLEKMAFAENVRLPLAVLYREAGNDKKEGKEEIALKFFPDKEKLEAAYELLHPKKEQPNPQENSN